MYIKPQEAVASLICGKELRGDMKHMARGTKAGESHNLNYLTGVNQEH